MPMIDAFEFLGVCRSDEIKQLGQWYRMLAMSAAPPSCASCHKKN